LRPISVAAEVLIDVVAAALETAAAGRPVAATIADTMIATATANANRTR
jgi:hypothetical protein